jgi:hypothetical protein
MTATQTPSHSVFSAGSDAGSRASTDDSACRSRFASRTAPVEDGVRRADVGLRVLEGLFQALRRLFFASVSNCTRPWAFGARRG